VYRGWSTTPSESPEMRVPRRQRAARRSTAYQPDASQAQPRARIDWARSLLAEESGAACGLGPHPRPPATSIGRPVLVHALPDCEPAARAAPSRRSKGDPCPTGENPKTGTRSPAASSRGSRARACDGSSWPTRDNLENSVPFHLIDEHGRLTGPGRGLEWPHGR
jgi:hypothetical protein